jgi:antagonist of KipI
MGIRVIKSGMADSLRDAGRNGFQHLGIPPGGAMDNVAMQVVNILVGNPTGAVVMEMHYPAPQLEFNSPALMALSGADFQATIDGVEIALNQPMLLPTGSVIKFNKPVAGARCYLGVKGGFEADEWLGSKTTNNFAVRGGYQGRNLQKGDWVAFAKPFSYEVVIAVNINMKIFIQFNNSFKKTLLLFYSRHMNRKFVFYNYLLSHFVLAFILRKTFY